MVKRMMVPKYNLASRSISLKIGLGILYERFPVGGFREGE